MSARLWMRFSQSRQAGAKLFVPFITAGDRGLAFTRRAVLALAEAGADAVELGIPFSDPIADGKIIQQSSQRALARGVTLAAIIQAVARIRRDSKVPVVLMGYLNPFYRPGLARIAQTAAAAGVDGFIIPDYPPEAAGEWLALCQQHGLDTIFLATPLSTDDRLRAVAKASTGYIYYVSVAGTTGLRHRLASNLASGVSRIRRVSNLPVLVGFGISTPEQARQAALASDGVIVGSALVKAMATGTDQAALARLSSLAKQMIKSVKSVGKNRRNC